MEEEERIARKKAAQAAAHKKWRESEKGRAYYIKNRTKIKLQRAGVDVVEIQNGEVSVK